MNKKNVILTFSLTKETRLILAKIGFIRYKTGKSIKPHGELSKLLNNIICDKFRNVDTKEALLISELINLEKIAKKHEKKMMYIANELTLLKEAKEEQNV